MQEGGKTVLVLGAGIGGIVCASVLRRELSKQHRVILVGPELVHSFPASFVWVIVGDRSRQEISRPLELKEHGVDFIKGKVDKVDPQKKRVTLGDGRDLAGDYIVVALGAELVPEMI